MSGHDEDVRFLPFLSVLPLLNFFFFFLKLGQTCHKLWRRYHSEGNVTPGKVDAISCYNCASSSHFGDVSPSLQQPPPPSPHLSGRSIISSRCLQDCPNAERRNTAPPSPFRGVNRPEGNKHHSSHSSASTAALLASNDLTDREKKKLARREDRERLTKKKKRERQAKNKRLKGEEENRDKKRKRIEEGEEPEKKKKKKKKDKNTNGDPDE